MSARWTPRSAGAFEKVGAPAAAELSALSARIPQGDEAIVSQGVSGRFSQRRFIYCYFGVFDNGQTVPLFTRTVYVVLVPRQGIESAPVANTEAAIAYMRRLHAQLIADRDGVVAFRWHVPPGRRQVTFPP